MALEDAGPESRGRGLNRYQKCLIHQLVRAEYPELVTISRADFIQLESYNKERQEAQTARRSEGLERNIFHQAGLRHVFEAICSNLEALLPHELISPTSSTVVSHKLLPSRLSANDTTLDGKAVSAIHSVQGKPILVGHNLFLDLVYLYACFLGSLPERVEEFLSALAKLFPVTVDTKYVADIINHNSSAYNSSLDEVDDEFSKFPSPLIG